MGAYTSLLEMNMATIATIMATNPRPYDILMELVSRDFIVSNSDSNDVMDVRVSPRLVEIVSILVSSSGSAPFSSAMGAAT